jgi:hypothetical protein
MQHYVIKFVSDLWQVCGFLRVLRPVTCGRFVVFSGYSGFFHQQNDRHDITVILLKVAFKHNKTNTLTLLINDQLNTVLLISYI